LLSISIAIGISISLSVLIPTDVFLFMYLISIYRSIHPANLYVCLSLHLFIHLFIFSYICTFIWGTGIRGLTRGLSTLPKVTGAFCGQKRSRKTPDELGREQVRGIWYFLISVLWHCWLGDRKGIWPAKSSLLVCWWWWFDWSFACLTAPVVTTTSIIRSASWIQNGDILVPAYSVCPAKSLLNECCYCCCCCCWWCFHKFLV